jgi:hypothetical protein
VTEEHNTLACTWEQFKRMAKEFREAAPTLNLEQLDNAWKCLGLGYLNMTEPMWARSAEIVLNMESRRYMARELELTGCQGALKKQSAH